MDRCPHNLKRDTQMAASKQTSSRVSTLAAKVLSGTVNPTKAQVKTLAATALSQDQTKGNKK